MHSIKTSFATISLLVLFVFACVAYIANAEEVTPQQRFQELKTQVEENRAERQEMYASTTEARQEMRAEAVENRQELRASTTEARTALKEERRTMLAERTQSRVKNLAANISNRVEAAIGRLDQIITRMEARMDLLEEQGVDVDDARAELENAKEALQNATDAIASIDTDVETVIGSEDPQAAWSSVRTVFTTVKSELQIAQTALKSSLALLKQAVVAAGLDSGVSSAVRNGAPNTTEAEAVKTENE